MQKKLLPLMTITLLLSLTFAQAADYSEAGIFMPLQISMYEPFELIWEDDIPIYGVRLTLLYGYSQTVRGLDLGLCNTAIDMSGVALSVINGANNVHAIQIGFYNGAWERSDTIQCGFYNAINGIGTSRGAQIGVINRDEALRYQGMLCSILTNYCDVQQFTGCQISGIGNYSYFMQQGFQGVMIGGLFNICQVGKVNGILVSAIANYIEDNSSTSFATAGVFNYTYRNHVGIQLAGGANIASKMRGAQISGFFNTLDYSGTGTQVSLVMNHCHESFHGFQMSTYNVCERDFSGLQLGFFINRTGEVATGSQIGIVNIADNVNGVQIGLVNMTRRMKGIQIGLCNIISEGPIPVLPFINGSFWL